MARNINNINANNSSSSSSVFSTNNSSNNDSGFLINYNTSKYGGIMRKSTDGEYYIVDDEKDTNNATYNNLGNLHVKTITADSIVSQSVSTIDSIAIKDNSILLASGNTQDLNNIGFYFQHSASKFSAFIKEKASGVFKLLDLTSLPTSLNQSFLNASYGSLYLKDLVSYGYFKLLNTTGWANSFKTSSSQEVHLSYTLPISGPSTNQVLASDGSGNLSWSSQVSINQSNISSLQTSVSSNTSNIASLQSSTSTNTTNISTNATNITSINTRLNNSKLYLGQGYTGNTQASNSIVLNADSAQLNPGTSGLFVSSLRQVPNYDPAVTYNPTTKELSYVVNYPVIIYSSHGSRYSPYVIASTDNYIYVTLCPQLATVFAETVNNSYQYINIPLTGRYRVKYNVRAVCTTSASGTGEIGAEIVYSAGSLTPANNMNSFHPSIDGSSYIYVAGSNNVSLGDECIKDFSANTLVGLRVYKIGTNLAYSQLQYSFILERLGPSQNPWNATWSVSDLDNYPFYAGCSLSNVYWADGNVWIPKHSFTLRPTYKLLITFSQAVPLKRLFYRTVNDNMHDPTKVEVYLGQKTDTSGTNLLATYTPNTIYANLTRSFDINYTQTSTTYTIYFYKTTDYEIYLDYLNFEMI